MKQETIKILLIEDNHADTDFIRKLLEGMKTPSFQIECVERMEDGLDRISKEEFDIILLDLYLPDSSGLETLSRLHERVHQIPVLVLTGLADNQTALEAVRKGAQDYLLKEKLNEDMLLRVIRYAIERNRLKLISHQTEEKYRVLFQWSNDGIILHDLQGNIIDANQRALDILGYNKSEVLGFNVSDLHPDRTAKDLYATITKQILSRGYALFEIQFKHKNGRVITAEVSASSFQLGKEKFIQKIIRDITERKRTEQILVLQDIALKSTANGIVITDREGTILWVNSAFSDLTGYSYKEAVGKNPRILKSDIQNEEFYKNLWDTILAGKVWRGELINVRKDGTHYFEEQTITPVKNDEGQITHFIGIKTDITERRLAEDKLKDSEEKFRSVAETATDAIISADSDGKITYINQAAEAMFGYSADQVSAKSLTILMPKRYREAHQNGFNRFLETGESHLIGNSVEMVGRKKDGSEFPVEMSLSSWMSGGETFFTAVIRDISERKHSENALRERERYLQALNKASQLLISSPDIPYQEFVDIIGPASQASRTYVFLNHRNANGELFASQIAEWCAQGIDPQTDNTRLQHVPYSAMPSWEKNLSQGKMIIGKVGDLPRKERKFLASQGIQSVMLLPLLVDNDFMGLIGFDNCVSDRIWEPVEQEFLRAAASDLAKAMRRKTAENSLKKSEDRFRSIFEEGPMGIALIGPDLKYIRTNKAFCQMLGYTEEELRKRTMLDITHPNDFERDKAAAQALFNGQIENFRAEKRYVKKNKSFIWANINVSVIKDAQGNVQYIITSIEDITERKRAEEALKASEKKFKQFFNNVPDAIFVTQIGGKSPGKILDVNPAAEIQTGYSRDELIGMNILKDLRTEPYSEDQLSAEEKKLLSDKTLHLIEKKRRKDGSEYWTEVQVTTIDYGNEPVSLSVNRDVTERIRTQRTLQEHEQKLRTIIEHSNELFYIHNTEHVLTYISPQCKRILGYTPEEMMVKWTTLVTDNPINEEGFRITEKAIKSGKRQPPYLLELRKKDGAHRLVEIDESPVKDENGKVIGISGALRDVTDREKAEEALRNSEEKYRTIFEESKDALYISSVEGKFLDVNPAGVELFGYDSLAELKTVNIQEAIYANPLDRNRFQDALKRQGNVKDYEINLKKKNGEQLTVLVTANAMKDEHDQIIAYRGMIRDITKQKALERQLLQAQKMEAIGTLAGGIAHDFNNILGAILGYTELTKELLKDDGTATKNLEQVYKAGLRARDLVHQILTFSRQTDHKPHPLQIESVVKEALKMLRATLPSTIEIRQDIQKDCGYVLADPTQIHQVIMNLCTNAHDALRPGGGTLEISLHRVSVNNNKVLTDGRQLQEEVNLPKGNYLKLTLRDNGTGMDYDTLKRIFDPFFTTKEAGSGTGLGLSVVHGIVKKHDGEITVWSEPGKGTTFNVYLPEYESKVEEVIEEHQEFLHGSERILYVDDEEPIVQTGVQILQSLGYQVTGKTQSLEALQTFKQSPDQFDLIITDLTMPKMTGLDLAKKTLEIRPDIPIILITGFSDTITQDNAIEMGIREILMKPFLTSDLSAAIRRALAAQKITVAGRNE